MVKRLFTGVVCALLLGLLTFTVSQAQATDPDIYGSGECSDCHEAVTAQWQNSRHGHASVADSFLAAWADQGNPPDCLRCHTTGYDSTTGTFTEESVSCATCHPSNPEEHPQKIMQTDISSRLCGQCHVDSFAEWETSQHGQEELTCARCHNPHSNELRAGSMQDTCRTCHKEETHFFTFTAHAEEGLLCTDCHLQTKTTPLGNGHSQHAHTFSVGSDTCTTCHQDEMHFPNQSTNETEIMQGSLLTTDGSADDAVATTPSASSPFNFAILAALIGMAFGLVGSPWLERWQERLRSQA